LILNDQTKAINYTLTYSGLSANVGIAPLNVEKRDAALLALSR
jgi:hypothetical protein